MREITFGQYYPSNSIIHKLDARIKIILSLFYMIGIFFVQSYVMYSVVLTFIFLIIFISKIPIRLILKSVKSLIFIVLFFSIINIFFYKEGNAIYKNGNFVITLDGIDNSIKITLRLFLLVMGTVLLTFTTTPNELTDGVESLLSPLKYIKIPVHDFAIIISLALRFIPGFIEDTDKIIMAQKSRGADFDSGNIFKKAKAYIPVLIPLFVSAFQKADQLAEALDSRCYNATQNRTKYKKSKIKLKDFIATFLVITLFIFVFLDKYYFNIASFTEDKLSKLILGLVKV